MRWQGRQQSGNVEDRRGMGGNLAIGGGIGGVIVLILGLIFGGDFTSSIPTEDTGTTPQESASGQAPADDEAQFVSVVLKDTEDVWTELFAAQGNTYRKPKMVLFTNSTPSACGYASAASGPFYCPEDYQVYIDLSFIMNSKTGLALPAILQWPMWLPMKWDIMFSTCWGLPTRLTRPEAG